MKILPLYSLLPSDKQQRVFEPAPAGVRLCVVSTNVAETSITIPDVRFVVDTGKVKTKLFDKRTGATTFSIIWESKAAAEQRCGRAGRTTTGHCYRLFSSAVFNDEFEKFTPSEITLRPIEDLVLQMKSMHILKVVNFPFPSPPGKEGIIEAETELEKLGALVRVGGEAKITKIGQAMAQIPLAPRFSKLLVLAMRKASELLPYVIAVVSALTVPEVLVENAYGEAEDDSKRLKLVRTMKSRWAGEGQSLLLGDLVILLKAVGGAEFSGMSTRWCESHCLRFKGMKEIRALRRQLTNILNLSFNLPELCMSPKLAPPTEADLERIRALFVEAMPHFVAKRVEVGASDESVPVEDLEKAKKLAAKGRYAYKCLKTDELIYIHPNSVLVKENPRFILYQELFESGMEVKKLFAKVVCGVEVEWLPQLALSMCKSEEMVIPGCEDVVGDDDARVACYDAARDEVMCYKRCRFGALDWDVPPAYVPYPEGVARAKFFAMFLLRGEVCGKLAEFAPKLLSPPEIMLKSWAKLQKRTQVLLKALCDKAVVTKKGLLAQWEENDKFLLEEYLEWIPKDEQYRVRMSWPPVEKEN